MELLVNELQMKFMIRKIQRFFFKKLGFYQRNTLQSNGIHLHVFISFKYILFMFFIIIMLSIESFSITFNYSKTLLMMSYILSWKIILQYFQLKYYGSRTCIFHGTKRCNILYNI